MALRARKGIPHLGPVITPKGNKAPTLSEGEFNSLYRDGMITISRVTEKTDGMAWIIGYDAEGLFTMHSGSGGEKARTHEDHMIRAAARGVTNFAPYEAMAFFHHALLCNDKLQSFLDNRFNGIDDVIIRGEAFLRDLAIVDVTNNTITFNKIPYRYDKLGAALGTFVVHTELEDNQGLDVDVLKRCGGGLVTFDDDRYTFKPITIHEVSNWLNLPLDFKKTVAQNAIQHYFDQHVPPKWGPVREGIIVHPCAYDRARFKIISEEFQNAQRSWK